MTKDEKIKRLEEAMTILSDRLLRVDPQVVDAIRETIDDERAYSKTVSQLQATIDRYEHMGD